MKKIFTTAVLLSAATAGFAQVKIGDNPSTINPSAVLDIEHPNKGVLFPRVSLTNTTTWGLAGATPIAGMTVYNNNAAITSSNLAYPALPGGVGEYYWNGTGWVAKKFVDAWTVNGNAGTNGNINFLGTTDNHPLKFKVNNMLAGFIDSNVVGSSTTFGLLAGNSSVGVGYRTFNTFMGFHSGMNNTVTANTFQGRNTGVGANSLEVNTTGYENTAIGYIALQGNTSGFHNTAVGSQAMANSSALVVGNAGEGNTAVGWKSIYSNTGSFNTGLGFWALGSNNDPSSVNTGSNNVAVGSEALYRNTTGSNNIAIGFRSGYFATTASNNVLIGYNAGLGIITESDRLIIRNPTSSLIEGDFSTGVVTLNSVLKLNPLPAAPSSPTKGMIYFDSTTNKAYCYDGTTWQALF